MLFGQTNASEITLEATLGSYTRKLNLSLIAFFTQKKGNIVITFYSPSFLGQETAKGPFGLRVKLPVAHLSATHGGGFTLFL